MQTIRLEVVSGEEHIFSGEATFVVIPTEMGELGVYPLHEPLLGKIRPGVLRIKTPESEDDISLAISGGILEIQPDCITVLSDVVVRSKDLDEKRANDAKAEAEKRLSGAHDANSKEEAEKALAAAMAQLKALDFLRTREKR